MTIRTKPALIGPVNTLNQSWRGTFDYLPFNERAGKSARNYASRVANASVTGTPTWIATKYGVGVYCHGGSSFDIPDHGTFTNQNFSLRSVVKIVSWPGDFAALFDKGSGGNRDMSVFFDTSGNINGVQFGAGFSGISISTGLAAGGTYDLVLAFNASAGSLSAYVDGILKGTASTPAGTLAEAFPLALGRNASGGGVDCNAIFLSFQSWKRVLSAAEVRRLHTEEGGWGMLRRPHAVFGTIASSGVTGNGVLASAASSADGAGVSGSTGTGVADSVASAIDGSGVSESAGTGDLFADAATVAGSGGLGAVTGTGDLGSNAAGVEGAGVSLSTGTGDPTADSATVDGAGVSLSTGSGDLSASAATVVGSGAGIATGAGELTADASSIEGSGTSASTGTGDLTSGVSHVVGSAEEVATGTGDLLSGDSDTSGAGVSGSAGMGELIVLAPAITAAGVSGSTGLGALAANDNEIDGEGTSLSTGTGTLLAAGSDITGSSAPRGSAIPRGSYLAAVARGSYSPANPRT